MDKFRVTFRNPRTENKDLQCEPAFPATSAEDARAYFVDVAGMVDVSVEPVEEVIISDYADVRLLAKFGDAL